MELYIYGDPKRSSRYTTVPHAEVGAPHKQWTVYINPAHTDYVPLGTDESDRAARVLELGRKFGLKPIRRVKPNDSAAGQYVLYLLRVPKTDLHRALQWDGTFIEQGPAVHSTRSA